MKESMVETTGLIEKSSLCILPKPFKRDNMRL